jgi:hypothetical protein
MRSGRKIKFGGRVNAAHPEHLAVDLNGVSDRRSFYRQRSGIFRSSVLGVCNYCGTRSQEQQKPDYEKEFISDFKHLSLPQFLYQKESGKSAFPSLKLKLFFVFFIFTVLFAESAASRQTDSG